MRLSTCAPWISRQPACPGRLPIDEDRTESDHDEGCVYLESAPSRRILAYKFISSIPSLATSTKKSSSATAAMNTTALHPCDERWPEGPDEAPFPPCGRRWPEGPDEAPFPLGDRPPFGRGWGKKVASTRLKVSGNLANDFFSAFAGSQSQEHGGFSNANRCWCRTTVVLRSFLPSPTRNFVLPPRAV